LLDDDTKTSRTMKNARQAGHFLSSHFYLTPGGGGGGEPGGGGGILASGVRAVARGTDMLPDTGTRCPLVYMHWIKALS
jgi:hypothetical protein